MSMACMLSTAATSHCLWKAATLSSSRTYRVATRTWRWRACGGRCGGRRGAGLRWWLLGGGGVLWLRRGAGCGGVCETGCVCRRAGRGSSACRGDGQNSGVYCGAGAGWKEGVGWLWELVSASSASRMCVNGLSLGAPRRGSCKGGLHSRATGICGEQGRGVLRWCVLRHLRPPRHRDTGHNHYCERYCALVERGLEKGQHERYRYHRQ